MVAAYDGGLREEVMLLNVSVRTALATLNALCEHSLHIRRFYKDLSPYFGENYKFTIKDLHLSDNIEKQCLIYYSSESRVTSEIYNISLTSIVISILSKALKQRKIKKYKAYHRIIIKYFTKDFQKLQKASKKNGDLPVIKNNKTIILNPKKPKLHKPKRRKSPKFESHRPIIIYTPLGNDRRRRTRGQK